MRFNDALIGIVVIILGVVVVLHSQTFPRLGNMPGPALFPTIIGVLLALTGAVQVFRGIKSRAPLVVFLPGFNVKGVSNVLAAVLGVTFYIYAADWLGFLLTSFCIMFVMMMLMKGKLLPSVLSAAGAALCAYLIFNKMLSVPLPRGIFYF